MKIDTEAIRNDFKEIAKPDKVKVKLSKRTWGKSSIRISDRSYTISLNPDKIRTKNQLDKHLNF